MTVRLFRVGAGRGQPLGRVSFDFYAAHKRTIDSCEVYWDGDPALAACLPGVLFDERIGFIRSVDVEGRRLLAPEARMCLLDELEAWLDQLEAARDAGSELTSGGLRLGRGGTLVAQSVCALRRSTTKRRLWTETDDEPDDAEGVAHKGGPKMLWDWLLANATSDVDERIARLRAQADFYREYGPPADFLGRQIGLAPYAAWSDSPAFLALDQ